MSGIRECLDSVLARTNEIGDELPPYAVICGQTGSGKTPEVREWLEERQMDYYYIDAPSLVLYTQKGYEYIFPRPVIEAMDGKPKVIFIDNYDYAQSGVRNHLLFLIRTLCVVDPLLINAFEVISDGNSPSDPFNKAIRSGVTTKLNNITMMIVVTHPNLMRGVEEYSALEQQFFGHHK